MTLSGRSRFGLAGLLMTGLLVTALVLLFDALVGATRPPGLRLETSRLVLDRNGRLLRPFPVANGRWRLPVTLSEVDPSFIDMLLVFEDHRFLQHQGVDPRAILRAGAQMIGNGRIVSGGSTLTMQLVRLLDGRSTRNARGKLRQVLAALALERRAGKDAILGAYLNLAPYGGNLEGVRGASLAWFGKEPKRLTPAESALLVALPQSPEARRPDRDSRAARRARDRVLDRALAAGAIDQSQAEAARREPVPERRRPFPMLAAHTAERVVRERPGVAVHRLTIDAAVQDRMERLAAERAAALPTRVSVAMLVADHGTGEVIASVGSAGLFDEPRGGFVDMTRAVRSPGSTLKPLIYGLAFEAGLAHPESLIEDRPTGFAGYAPTNFDRAFHGTVTVRRALQLSLNVPAVKVLDAVGPARLVSRMRRAGATPVLSDLSTPGLAIGLGGVGVTLTDLVGIYAAIARGGRSVAVREDAGRAAAPAPVRRVLGERAAWYVASILAGVPAPANASPGGLAFKTGTSYGYRDAWAIGFDGQHLIGVWVGRPDSAPVPGLAGIDAAAPILIDAFSRLGKAVPLPAAPPGTLAVASADLPPPLRWVRDLRNEDGGGVPGPEIFFPPQGAEVDLGLTGGAGAALALKVRSGSPPFNWFANGAPIGRVPFARTARWTPDGPGYATLSVVDGRGRSSRVTVFLQ